jgi:regulator of protease activity HflC (stomatin/prohibitin superfamily)
MAISNDSNLQVNSGGPEDVELPDCCDTPAKCLKCWSWCAIICGVLVGIIVIISVSIKKVDNNEYAALYDVHSKQIDDDVRTGGLHTGTPGFKFIRFPSTFVTQDLQDTCLSLDGLRIGFDATFQFQMPEQWVVPAILKYRDFDTWVKIVASAGDSALQHTCSDYGISDFQNQRGAIQLAMEDSLRLKLEGQNGTGIDGVYAKTISLQLSNVDLPDRYSEAISEKQSANEDIQLAVNQRKQEVTKAETELLSAVEEGRKIADTAKNDANVTLTEALLKAEETLFSFEREAETIVRVKTNLNLTVEGVLGFIANNMLANVPHLKVSAGEPASFSQKDEF